MHRYRRLEISTSSSSFKHHIHIDSILRNSTAIRIRLDILRSNTNATRIRSRAGHRVQRFRFDRTNAVDPFWNYVRGNIRYRLDLVPSRRSDPRRDRQHLPPRQNHRRHTGLRLPTHGADRFELLPLRNPHNQCGNCDTDVPLRLLPDCARSHLTHSPSRLPGNHAGMDSHHTHLGAESRCQHRNNLLPADRNSSNRRPLHLVQLQKSMVTRVELSHRSSHSPHHKGAASNEDSFRQHADLSNSGKSSIAT